MILEKDSFPQTLSQPMTFEKDWVLATANSGKLAEFQKMLKPLNVRLHSLAELGLSQPDEDGESFSENALIKAQAAAASASMPALADDSGLVVDALGGAPGIFSARYAGDAASDVQNLQKLLAELEGCNQRDAAFHCALALVKSADDTEPLVVEARWCGSILLEPRGSGGFGYDPVFLVAEEGCSAAELPREVKNRISHRGQAVRLLLEQLPAGTGL